MFFFFHYCLTVWITGRHGSATVASLSTCGSEFHTNQYSSNSFLEQTTAQLRKLIREKLNDFEHQTQRDCWSAINDNAICLRFLFLFISDLSVNDCRRSTEIVFSETHRAGRSQNKVAGTGKNQTESQCTRVMIHSKWKLKRRSDIRFGINITYVYSQW